jgi:hypothetical protein
VPVVFEPDCAGRGRACGGGAGVLGAVDPVDPEELPDEELPDELEPELDEPVRGTA